MVDVLEELTADEAPSRRHVEARLDDWERRIRDLYAVLEQWLPSGWVARVSRSTSFISELMRDVGLPARELPVLALSAPGEREGLITPRGLWIVGANGRLDATIGPSRFLLVDRAENFAPPLWQIVPFDDRSRSIKLDRAAFLSALDRGR